MQLLKNFKSLFTDNPSEYSKPEKDSENHHEQIDNSVIESDQNDVPDTYETIQNDTESTDTEDIPVQKTEQAEAPVPPSETTIQDPPEINPENLRLMFQAITQLDGNVKKIESQLEEMKEEAFNENIKLQNQLDNKQIKLEQIMQSVQEDRYRKDRIKLINRCIYQADLVRKTIEDYSNMNLSAKKSADFLEKQLYAILTAMEATLEQEMLIRIQDGKDGDMFRPETQESIDIVPTDRPELDGKVHSSINPGYIWTLPYVLKARMNEKGEEIKNYRFLLRPEQVITYKLSE